MQATLLRGKRQPIKHYAVKLTLPSLTHITRFLLHQQLFNIPQENSLPPQRPFAQHSWAAQLLGRQLLSTHRARVLTACSKHPSPQCTPSFTEPRRQPSFKCLNGKENQIQTRTMLRTPGRGKVFGHFPRSQRTSFNENQVFFEI